MQLRAIYSTVIRFIQGDPDLVVRYSRSMLVTGIIGCVFSQLLGGIGLITAFHCIGLGVSGESLAKWRTERGLWMLAFVFLGCIGFAYVGFVVGELRGLLLVAGAKNLHLLIDFTVSSFFLLAIIRFLAKVVKQNFAISRHGLHNRSH